MQTHSLSPTALLSSLLFQRLRWRLLILGASLFAATLGVLAPYAQKHFVDDLLSGGAGTEWVLGAFFLTLGAQAFSQLGMWIANREAVFSQKALGDAVYERILEGPGALVGRGPVGESVSLFAVDVPGATAILDQALLMITSMLFPLLLAPLALQVFFGIPFLASIGAILVIASINFVLARRQSRYFYSFKRLAAERTGLVSEWIQNIRALRILGWVEAAESRIFAVRAKETVNRKRMVTNGQVMNSIAGTASFALNILAILLLFRVREAAGAPPPTGGELLALLWILGIFLARPLRQLPWALVISMDSLSSIARMQAALKVPVERVSVSSEPTKQDHALEPTSGQQFSLEIDGLSLITGGESLLRDISMRFEAGKLTALVGEVGSGKSLLLKSLMGGSSATFQRYLVNGQPTQGPLDPQVKALFAFVPQEGFTMSATLRENVLLRYLDDQSAGSSQDARVRDALKGAQFDPDRERLAHGLDSEIGERGVNLSGGQRQRIALARAEFADRPIILMDDCLSAVDVDTERHLIDELLCDRWKDRTRVLATHRMAVLPRCDRIYFLEAGAVVAQGRFEELLRAESRFAEFVRREAVRESRALNEAKGESSDVLSLAEGRTDGSEPLDAE